MRQDIQFLRGYAVAIVILAHAKLSPVAGHLGVDIFFVISGYLITRMLQIQLSEGQFSFREFYTRRAKRLLPAAYATFLLTSFASPFFLTSVELTAYWDQLVGALLFSSNIVLSQQSGYFDSSAELKPLLHIWSLSLEEQYYFCLPLILLVIRRRYWPQVTLGLLFFSTVLCAYWMTKNPSYAFYMLPTRAWELSIGSIVALLRLDDPNPQPIFRLTFWPCLAALLIVPFAPTGLPHPGLDATIICLSTAIVIINGKKFFENFTLTRLTSWIGNASYSLYLVQSKAEINFAELRRPNFGLAKECDQYSDKGFLPKHACMTGKNPEVAVWGDSFGMHLIGGILASTNLVIIQATRSSCPPVFGYAQFNNSSKYTESWAHQCIKFNKSVLRYLSSSPTIKTVVIGSTFSAFTLKVPWRAVVYGRGNKFTTEEITPALSIRTMWRTIRTLRKIGKQVVIVAPPPSSNQNQIECVERNSLGIVTWGRKCSITLESDKRVYTEQLEILNKISRSADVPVVDPRSWMCDKNECKVLENGIVLYRDATHLSEMGSSYLGKKYNWQTNIIERAK